MIKSNNIEVKKQGKLKFENKISTPFTWVENELIKSKALSFEALGLYLVLRSFGDTVYPTVNYLCKLGRTGRDRLRRIINELLEAKLLIKKQEKQQGLFSRTIYRILSINDDYEQVYEEFTGEELLNPQTLDNAKSHPLTENPSTDFPSTENPPLIRIIIKKNHIKNSLPLTPSSEGESERDIFLKIKNLKTFKNYDNDELIKSLCRDFKFYAFTECERLDKKEKDKFDNEPKIKDPGAYILKTLWTLYPAGRRYFKGLIKEKTNETCRN